jgi:hypothetical protein
MQSGPAKAKVRYAIHKVHDEVSRVHHHLGKTQVVEWQKCLL